MKSVRPTGVQSQGMVAASAGSHAADDLGLTMYGDPPHVEMSVREFEDMTKDRLKLLHAFDRQCGYDTMLGQIPDKRSAMMPALQESNLWLVYPTAANRDSFLEQKAEFKRRDATSHYALRLAFSKSREARDWLVRQEQRLFLIRYGELADQAQEAFIKNSGVHCRRFDPEGLDKGVTLDGLTKTTPSAKIWAGDVVRFERNFYVMPFSEVAPALIAKRQVVIKAGYAYVPNVTMKLILAAKFKERLTSALDVAEKGAETAFGDPRVGGFLRLIKDHGMQLMVTKTSNSDDPGEKLSLVNFEEIMVRSFPPCMRRLVEKQRETKQHLKHSGRLQLRPFLKECGFVIEESMRWWKQEFSLDATVFEKNYVYDIEHTYGKKGHFQGQNSFGCMKIIAFPGEAAGQSHGCPFKQLDPAALRTQMHKWHVPESYANSIEKEIANGKHFQLACVKYFEAIHPGSEGEGVGNSPGDFYKQSCKCHAKKAEAQKASSPEKLAGASSKSG